MKSGTAEDYAFLQELEDAYVADQPARIIELLRQQENSFSGYKIDRLQHSLQTATRALRDQASEDWVVAALLHDIGDSVAAYSHGEFAAAILRPFVSEEIYWTVKYHPIIQEHYYVHHLGKDRNRRDRLSDHPYYAAALRFCEFWDQASFDPDYDTLPLSAFEPMLWKVLGRQPHSYPESSDDRFQQGLIKTA